MKKDIWQAIIGKALSEEQREQGFSLVEEEDFLNLVWQGRVVAVFSAYGATFQAIRETAGRIELGLGYLKEV